MSGRRKNRRKMDDQPEVDVSNVQVVGIEAPPASELFPNGVDGFDVRGVFTQLTRWTTPRGFEWKQFDTMLTDAGFNLDATANYQGVVLNPDGTMPETVFIAHMDTVSTVPPKRIEQFIADDTMFTDGKTNLGADDKAGCTVLMYLLSQKVPGFYVFAWGEETGREGSRALTTRYSFAKFKRAIAFDRRGFDSIITKQNGQISCSDEFADALIEQLGKHGMEFKKDPGGSFTDTVSFFGEVPECTNISVGYENAHSNHETQDLAFLERLCYAVGRVDWESLPAVQDAKKRYAYAPAGKYQPPQHYGAYKGSQGGYYGSRGGWGSEDFEPVPPKKVTTPADTKTKTETFRAETKVGNTSASKELTGPKAWDENSKNDMIDAQEAWDEITTKSANRALEVDDIERLFYDYPDVACEALYHLIGSASFTARQFVVGSANAERTN